jgi:anthranilate 1,2-dioxygenase small subunit
MIPGYELATLDPRAAREARGDIEDFHHLYCHTLDSGEIERWPEFFTTDCFYEVIARENVEAGMPVGLIYCEGRSMIRDRAYAVKHTQMFAPRYLQHFVTNVMVRSMQQHSTGEEIKALSNYLLLQTLVESPTTILQAGRYYDTFLRQEGRLLLKERHCVYDTSLIANDLVFPI